MSIKVLVASGVCLGFGLAALPTVAIAESPRQGARLAAPVTPLLSAWDPVSPPDDLENFTSRVNESVATVYCANSSGAGWSSATTLRPELIASGYQSYMVTSASLVRGCTAEGRQEVQIRHKGVSYAARVWTSDFNLDLAAVVTKAKLPQLLWSPVPKPSIGQWVAAFGNSTGLESPPSIGAVTSVGVNDLTSSAQATTANAGGPLVTNDGRVVGITTVGGVRGTPSMCVATHVCNDSDDVWITGDVPSAPQSPTVTQQGRSITVRWTAPASDGGQEIRAYQVEGVPGGKTCLAVASTSCTMTAAPDDTALRPGVSYTFQVQAINDIGPGTPATTAAITLASPPGKVMSLQAQAVKGGLKVSWGPPTGASPGTTYEYRVGSGAWKASKGTSVIVKGLKSGRSVTVTVRAKNAGGAGPLASVKGTPL